MSHKITEAVELGRKDRAERDTRVRATKEMQRVQREARARLATDIKTQVYPLFRSAYEVLCKLGHCSIVDHDDRWSLEFEGDSFEYAKPVSHQLEIRYELDGKKGGGFVAIDALEEAIAKWVRGTVATLDEAP